MFTTSQWYLETSHLEPHGEHGFLLKPGKQHENNVSHMTIITFPVAQVISPTATEIYLTCPRFRCRSVAAIQATTKKRSQSTCIAQETSTMFIYPCVEIQSGRLSWEAKTLLHFLMLSAVFKRRNRCLLRGAGICAISGAITGNYGQLRRLPNKDGSFKKCWRFGGWNYHLCSEMYGYWML